MSCPGTPVSTDGDLIWGGFSTSPVSGANPRPGDQMSVNMQIVNNPIGSVNSNANILFASNIRVFLSFDTVLGPEDYFVGEYVLPSIYAAQSQVIVASFSIPHPTAPPQVSGTSTQEILKSDGSSYSPKRYYDFNELYFPASIPIIGGASDPNYNQSDPDRPEYIGPISIEYNIIAVLDAQNCVLEKQPPPYPTNEPSTPVYMHQSDTNNIYGTQTTMPKVTVWNPNLPNLQIRFLGRQPASPLPALGGTIITQWEIVNTGIGAISANERIGIRVFYSEDNSFSSWDPNIVVPYPIGDPMALGPDGIDRTQGSTDDMWVIDGPIFGNSTKVVNVQCRLPYDIYRANDYAGAYSQLSAWAGIDEFFDRSPPPANVPGWVFRVYNPIPSNGQLSNHLIAQVDASNAVREAAEHDNMSTFSGPVGTLNVGAQNGGVFDMAAVDLFVQQTNPGGPITAQLKYDYGFPSAGIQSIGLYLSSNNTAQSSDFFMERFWVNIAAGVGNTMTFTFSPTAYNPKPPPGAYYLVVVLDDIFKEAEVYEDNNYVVSRTTITWQ